MRVPFAVLSTVLAALAGCAGCDSVPDEAVTDCDMQVVPGGAATDILFVVDDSGSMAQEQEELAANLGQFIDALVNSPVRLDVRIGVTNSSIHGYAGGTAYGGDAWDGTAWVPFPGTSGTPYPAGAVVAIRQDADGGIPGQLDWGFDPDVGASTWRGSRVLPSGPSLVRDFKANVLQGIWGSGKEQPLAAMKLALEKATAGAVNFGFQRAGARLAVVVLTDEDDCSSPPGAVTSDSNCRANSDALTPLSDYVTFLGTTAFADAGPPVFALIAGYDPAGTSPTLCRGWDPGFVPTTSTSAAAVPNRLDAFVGLLEAASPGRTLTKSICGSFGPSLLQIASMIIPQTLPLEQAPGDWRMMTVAVNRGTATEPCTLALAGSPEEATAEAVFTPPQAGTLASIRFEGACRLGIGDRVDIGILCVR